MILIAGPTASGKSALAVRLAQQINGSVINADSMQVYDALPLLTAQPAHSEMAGIPHHLYGFVPPDQRYSVGRYLTDVRRVISTVQAAGRIPVLTGGTGLYFHALLHGLANIPAITDRVRQQVHETFGTASPDRLHAALAAVDPVLAARLAVNDRQRHIRALEVWHQTGRSLSDWQMSEGQSMASPPVIAPATKVIKFALTPERAQLYARCDQRFDQMMAAGAVQEVRHFLQLRLDPGLPVTRALGVPELSAYLARPEPGTDTVSDHVRLRAAVTQAKTRTRRYAKRQMTWIRQRMTDWPKLAGLDTEQNALKILARIER